MYRIVTKEALKPTVILYEIEAPMVAKKAQPGQFIILRVDENGERIPITIHDYDREKAASPTKAFVCNPVVSATLINSASLLHDIINKVHADAKSTVFLSILLKFELFIN